MQLLFAVFFVDGGKEHTAGVLTHHLAVGQVQPQPRAFRVHHVVGRLGNARHFLVQPGATPGAAQEGWYSIDAGLWLHVQRVANLLPSGLRLGLPDAPAAAPIPVDERLLYLMAAEVRPFEAAVPSSH